MKGFIYLIEIAVAGIMIAVILGALMGVQTVRSDWERSDLIANGNNIFYSLENSGKISNLLYKDFSEIQEIKPENVEYGIRISGIAKSDINVACISNCGFIENLLTPSFVNNRTINFHVFQTSIDSLEDYDALIVVNNTNIIKNNKARIMDYLNKNGVVVLINNMINNNDPDINEIFNLTPTTGSFAPLYFTDKLEVVKYFNGLGFDSVCTSAGCFWTIWGNEKQFEFRSPQSIILEGVGELQKGDIFSLIGPDGNSYSFTLKRIIFPTRIDIQPVGNFVFKNFISSAEQFVTGDNVVSDLRNNFATMTFNRNAVWISYFPKGDEYKTLVKSSLASKINNWELKEVNTTKETVTVSTFTNLCCDVSEIAEITLVLWYRF